MDRIRHCDTPLGGVTLAADGEALVGLWFDGQKRFAAGLAREYEEGDAPVLREAEEWLAPYFAGREPPRCPKLAPRGTPFQRAVWEILLTVPYGRATTYGRIAEALARRAGLARMSAQAVGGAVGRNPIALIVPCHRVVGADGSLTGYAGGLARKEALLRLERADLCEPFLP
uniref:Methylated-DNA--protein-cysteine methyltransferase n=1 Tax=uncultured bacterium Contig99 TaxID=1393639 RepID=W0FNS4_9BACT|nr:methylated-DNA/protein-cysteinemethyltransferase [uncultured bacterium Contig99]